MRKHVWLLGESGGIHVSPPPRENFEFRSSHKGQSVKGEILIVNFIFNLMGEFSVRKGKLRKNWRFSQLAFSLYALSRHFVCG